MEIKYNGFLYVKNTDFQTALKIVSELDCMIETSDDRTEEYKESAFDVIVYLDLEESEFHDISDIDTDKLTESIEFLLMKSAIGLGIDTKVLEFEAENYLIDF